MKRTPLFLLRNGGWFFVDNQCNFNCIASTTDRHIAKAKTLFILLAITLLAVGLSSCKKEIVGPDNNSGTPDTPASEYIVSNLSMNIPAEGGDCSFSFKTTDAWTASVINGRADGWLTFSPTSGLSGNVTVTVTASKNEGYEDRSATLRIVSGKNTTDLLITQKQKDALLVNATKYEVPEDGGDVSIEVKSNVNYDYTLEDADGWLTENTAKTRAMETRTLSFVVSPNESTDRREGRIVFTDGNLKEVVSIYQGAAKAPEKPDPRILLSKKDITIESKGGTVKIEAVSGKNVSIKIPEGYGWIQEGNKESTNTFYLTVSENSSLDNREGFVSFTDAESGFSENVNILQLSKDAIVVSKSSYSFGLEGGTLAMDVVSNMQVNASSDADWLSLAKSKAVDSQLVFSIAGAEAGTDRAGVITLRSGSAVQKISVRQFPMDSPIVFECKAVKDRLVELFDADCDGELSYKEAAEVTTLMNVFTDGKKPSVNMNSITAFDELQYFTSLTEIAPYTFNGANNLNKVTLPPGIKVIGKYAFSAKHISKESYEQGVRGLDTIILPEGLEEIGQAAFAGRPLSNGVVFPSTLKTIGLEAFRRCCYYSTTYDNGNIVDETIIGLKNITLPESVERIYSNAFYGCAGLESVELSSSIQSIEAAAFARCPRLKSITGTAVSRDGGAVVNHDGVLMFFIGSKKNEYTIPEGVRSLYPHCGILYLNDGIIQSSTGYPYVHLDGTTIDDQDSYLIKTLVFPSSFEKPAQGFTSDFAFVKSFKGKGATPDGKGLVIDNSLIAVARAAEGDFEFPSSVTEIGPEAFAYSAIKNIVIPDSVQEIGSGAFIGCQSLESVKLPKSCTIITDNMFSYCKNLTSIDGIEKATDIEHHGLYGCKKILSHFKVPASVKRLGASSLDGGNRDIIEFQSLIPPHIVNEPNNEQNTPPFNSKTTIYVPDIAYDRYHSKHYNWGNIETRKLSELYSTPAFHTREFDSQNSFGENLHVLRITEEGKDEESYHYDLIKVEAGSFERKTLRTPSKALTVNITKDYYIAATEFPQWLWIDVMHFNPSKFTDNFFNIEFTSKDPDEDYYDKKSDFRPVEGISWEDCAAFIKEFNKLTGLSMRLPSEAEWEYAARGGKHSRGYTYSGSNTCEDVAQCENKNSTILMTYPCGLLQPNELNLYDMNGNVWEWCQDYYEDWGSPVVTIPSGDDPTGPEETPYKVIRGGDYNTFYTAGDDGFIGNRLNRLGYNGASISGFRPAL